MSAISGLGSILPPSKPQETAATPPADQPATPGSVSDRLELSGVGHLLETLKSAGDVRVDKIAELKAQIEAGNYDSDGKKLDGATNGLLDDLEI